MVHENKNPRTQEYNNIKNTRIRCYKNKGTQESNKTRKQEYHKTRAQQYKTSIRQDDNTQIIQ